MSGTGVYYAEDRQNGSTEIKTGGTVLARIATDTDGKMTITLTKELFALYEEYMARTYGEAAVRVTYIRDSNGMGYTSTQTFTVL